MRVLVPLGLIALLMSGTGCSSTCAPCAPAPCAEGVPVPAEYAGGDCECPGCVGGGKTNVVHPVPDVRGMTHNAAYETLVRAGFVYVCCNQDPHHHNHNPNGWVQQQNCFAPCRLDVGDVVYLSFMPK
jgi:hypothetical protein